MGTGINKIRKLLKDAGIKPPQFEFGKFYTLTFFRPVIPDDKMSVKTSGKTSGKILNLISENPEITIPELANIIGVTERSIERNIQKLQEQNKLKRIGPAKGGYWKLIID